MKTVRFSNVVKKCGKPEVYLLLSKDDDEFKKALKSNRVMSLLGAAQGSKSGFGVVGYDEKQRGQLLVFPKSLAPFSDNRVVGIKYDLFDEEESPRQKKKSEQKKTESAKKPEPKKAPAKDKPAKPKKSKQEKVIPFPKQQDADEEEDESISEIKGYVRQALRALEKNNSVAAYNLLKRIL